jgi:hypothetical protein
MNTVFTIAQNRSLAHAHVLGASLKASNPALRFIIGLVDTMPVNLVSEFEILPVSDLKIEGFEAMAERYFCDEMLGATKPYFAAYLLKKYSKVFYFEAKSEVLASLDSYLDLLENHNMVLVPQLNHAHQIDDEKLVLNTGMFSSACFGLKVSTETDKLMAWWLSKMPQKAGFEPCIGIYSDQLWMNHIPVFFRDIYIDKTKRLNVGLWPNAKSESIIHQNYSTSKKSNANYQKALKATGFSTTIIPNIGQYKAPISPIKKTIATALQSVADGIDMSIKRLGERIW